MNKVDEYCLAIDQGTFSTRAVVYDSKGKAIHSAQRSIRLHRIHRHHVEQDAEEILGSLKDVLDEALFSNAAVCAKTGTAGLATQRSSILAWKPSTGQAISPLISWQDTRAADWLSTFSSYTQMVRSRTGLRLSPHYGVSKVQWLLRNDPLVLQALKKQDCVITPIASFLLFHLCEHKQVNLDIANASRMLLCNLKQRNWDEELLRLFDIPQQILANCQPTNSDFGTIYQTHIKINAVNGDQTAALYSDGEPDNRALRVNLGTGAFVLTPVSLAVIKSREFAQSELLAGISLSTQDQASYYMEGTVNGAGSALAWLEQNYTGLNVSEILKDEIDDAAQQAIFINAVGHFGSPIWRSDIQAHFIDTQISPLTPREALLAVLESIVFLLMLNIERMRSIKSRLLNIDIHKIEISGGLSNIDYLCQVLANITRLKIEKAQHSEATSRGIAWLASSHKREWRRGLKQKSWLPQSDPALQERYLAFKHYLRQQYGIV